MIISRFVNAVVKSEAAYPIRVPFMTLWVFSLPCPLLLFSSSSSGHIGPVMHPWAQSPCRYVIMSSWVYRKKKGGYGPSEAQSAASGGAGSEVANRPPPPTPLLARVTDASDPRVDSPSPDQFFVALAANEAWAYVELFAHLTRTRCAASVCVGASDDTFVVFEVVEAGKRVFILVELGG